MCDSFVYDDWRASLHGNDDFEVLCLLNASHDARYSLACMQRLIPVIEEGLYLPLQAEMRKYPLSVTSLKLKWTTGRVCPEQVSGICFLDIVFSSSLIRFQLGCVRLSFTRRRRCFSSFTRDSSLVFFYFFPFLAPSDFFFRLLFFRQKFTHAK